jgi:hypothetical protein
VIFAVNLFVVFVCRKKKIEVIFEGTGKYLYIFDILGVGNDAAY